MNGLNSSAHEGGYKSLPFFKQSEIIYDFTVEFVEKYIDYKSRTKDQMVQAARSGKQNIAEGYLQKSFEGKLKLLGVARGSLEELLNDYQDYLRQHQLLIWDKNIPLRLGPELPQLPVKGRPQSANRSRSLLWEYRPGQD